MQHAHNGHSYSQLLRPCADLAHFLWNSIGIADFLISYYIA